MADEQQTPTPPAQGGDPATPPAKPGKAKPGKGKPAGVILLTQFTGFVTAKSDAFDIEVTEPTVPQVQARVLEIISKKNAQGDPSWVWA